MKNLKIGSVAGIGIYLHWTFLLLVAAIFGFYYWQSQSVSAALVGMALILAVFVCVILHELGHALTARSFDVPTQSITLYPIGGLARLERIPSEPMKEFWIAVAGPAVNVLIAVALAAVLAATGGSFSPDTLSNPGGNVMGTLLWVNLALAGFNLLPAFPMDGGRVLRALLALKKPYPQATKTAAAVGQGMAVLFGLIGLLTMNPILLFIALFVYVGAQQESQQAVFRSLTEDTAVEEAMMTRFVVLAPDDTLGDAVDELLAGTDHDFPIVEDSRLAGLLRRKDLIQALAAHDRDTPVHEVASESCLTVSPDAPLEEAFQQMKAHSCSTVPVLHDGELLGLLTLENVGELVMVSSALKTHGGQSISRKEIRKHLPAPSSDDAHPAPPGSAR
jgi:Zn-dependent protease